MVVIPFNPLEATNKEMEKFPKCYLKVSLVIIIAKLSLEHIS
jgi:hypothetical protein